MKKKISVNTGVEESKTSGLIEKSDLFPGLLIKPTKDEIMI
jgi:hypothetical protein